MEQMKDRENLDQKYLGGVFDRQVRMEDWDQETVQNQTVFVLGIGGLGSTVVISLLRLGVGRIFMVDYDVVDAHNLNRQLLFSPADVGQPKVEAALKNSHFHNTGSTQVDIFHGNALTNWEKMVEFAKQSTFIYNCIDWGDKFDIAVASLCFNLKLPLVMGGTFSTSMTVDYFPPNGRPCYLCSQSIVAAPEVWEKVRPEIITQLKDISFLPKNNNPVGRSSVAVCLICGELMVSHLLNWMFLCQDKPYPASRLIFYHNTFEIVKFQVEQFKKCPFCSTEEDRVEFEKEQEEKREEERKRKEEEAQKARETARIALEEATKARESSLKTKQEALRASEQASKAQAQAQKTEEQAKKAEEKAIKAEEAFRKITETVEKAKQEKSPKLEESVQTQQEVKKQHNSQKQSEAESEVKAE